MKVERFMSIKELEEIFAEARGTGIVSDKDLGETTAKGNRYKNLVKENRYQIIGIAGILALALIFGATFIVNSCSSNLTRLEYLRKRELERKCAYILPSEGRKTNYRLKTNEIVSIEHYDTWRWNDACLKIYLDDVIFESKGTSLEDLRALKTLKIKNGSEWEVFPEGEIRDYDSWQKKYEELIYRIAETRGEFEKNTLENLAGER